MSHHQVRREHTTDCYRHRFCGGEGGEAMALIGNTRKSYFESFLDMNFLRKTSMGLLNKSRTGKLIKKLMMLKASLDPPAMLDVLF